MCEDSISSTQRGRRVLKDRQGNWKQAWPYYDNLKWQKVCVCAITDELVAESSRGKRVEVQAKRMQERGGDAKRHPECAADKVPSNDDCGRCVSTDQSSTAKTAAVVRQACCRSMGIGITGI